MFIELVEVLRCVGDHAAIGLVAQIDRLQDRHIVEGALGCPACGARYPVTAAVADFRRQPQHPIPPRRAPDHRGPTDEDVLRARALLDLGDGGGIVALVGSAAAFAPRLSREVDANYLLVNPPENLVRGPWSTLLVDAELPVTPGRLRAVLVGSGGPTIAMDRLVSAVRVGGRLVAPRNVAPPADWRVLATDDREWVAQRPVESGAVVVPIARRPRE